MNFGSLFRIPQISKSLSKQIAHKIAGIHGAEPALISLILEKYGHQRSHLSKTSIDQEGKPIPWFTYPSIEYLSQLDWSESTILEYSSGNGSLWWSNRCREIISVEDDLEWFNKTSAKKNTNQVIHFFQQKESYIHAFDDCIGKANIIIIDGSHRLECAEHLINIQSQLTSLNAIILDNSDWFPNICETLRNRFDFLQIDFSGIGPINTYPWTTSIFIHRNWHPKNFGLQPQAPMGSIKHDPSGIPAI